MSDHHELIDQGNAMKDAILTCPVESDIQNTKRNLGDTKAQLMECLARRIALQQALNSESDRFERLWERFERGRNPK